MSPRPLLDQFEPLTTRQRAHAARGVAFEETVHVEEQAEGLLAPGAGIQELAVEEEVGQRYQRSVAALHPVELLGRGATFMGCQGADLTEAHTQGVELLGEQRTG